MPTKEELLAQLPQEVKDGPEPSHYDKFVEMGTSEQQLAHRIIDWAKKQGLDMDGIYSAEDAPSWSTTPDSNEVDKALGVMYAAQQAKEKGKQVEHPMDPDVVQDNAAGFLSVDQIAAKMPGLTEGLEGVNHSHRLIHQRIREFAQETYGVDIDKLSDEYNVADLPLWSRGGDAKLASGGTIPGINAKELGALAKYINDHGLEKNSPPPSKEVTGLTLNGVVTVPVQTGAPTMQAAKPYSPYSQPKPETKPYSPYSQSSAPTKPAEGLQAGVVSSSAPQTTVGAGVTSAPVEPKSTTPDSQPAPPPPPADKKTDTPQPEKSAFEVFKGMDVDDKKNILHGIVAQDQALTAAWAAYGRGGKAHFAADPESKGGLYRAQFLKRVNGAADDPDKAVVDDKTSQGFHQYVTDLVKVADQQLIDIQLVEDGSMSREEYWGKYRSAANWNRPLEEDKALVEQIRDKTVALARNLVGVAVDAKMPAEEMDMTMAKLASVNMPFQHIRQQAEAYKKGVTERFEKNVTATYEKNYLLAQQRSAQEVAGRMGSFDDEMQARLDEMAEKRKKSKKPTEKSPQEKSLEELQKTTKAFRDLANTDTSQMSKEDLLKHDLALSQATMAMDKAAKDFLKVNKGDRISSRYSDPINDLARQVAAAADYTSTMSKANRAQLRTNYAADRRRMEQAVAQRTTAMRTEYMRQAGMLPQAPAQQMRQMPQQMQAQFMQAQTAYRQTTMQFQAAQTTMQSLQMQMLQAQRNLAAAEMARYQARMQYLDVQIQMAQMGMAPQQMGMAPQQMGMAPQQMGMMPQQMGMTPMQMGMMPMQMGMMPMQMGVMPARMGTPQYRPLTQAPPRPVAQQASLFANTPYANIVSQPLYDLMQRPLEKPAPTTPQTPKPKPKLDTSLDGKINDPVSPIPRDSMMAVHDSIDRSKALTAEEQKGLFTEAELNTPMSMSDRNELGHIRQTAKKEGIDLKAPVDQSLIPAWAKGKDVSPVEREMGLLAAHREANRQAKQYKGLDTSLDGFVDVTEEDKKYSREKMAASVGTTPLKPEEVSGLLSTEEMNSPTSLSEKTQLAQVRRKAQLNGINLQDPVDPKLIPLWAKGENVPQADKELGLLAAHMKADERKKAGMVRPKEEELKAKKLKAAPAPTKKTDPFKPTAQQLQDQADKIQKAAQAKKAATSAPAKPAGPAARFTAEQIAAQKGKKLPDIPDKKQQEKKKQEKKQQRPAWSKHNPSSKERSQSKIQIGSHSSVM